MENQKYKKTEMKLTAEQRLKALRQDQESNGIGKRIKALRAEQQLTGSELAALVDTTQSAISDIENGKRHIDCYDLPKFAAALNTTVDYICSGLSPENMNIGLETGLSENALETLKWYKSSGNNGFSALLNFLLLSAEKDKEIYQETIGQDLLQELQDYIFSGNDFVCDIEIGYKPDGQPLKRKMTVKDTSIFRIQTCLEYLNQIYYKQRYRQGKPAETGKNRQK
jgi:transcriptional regulator with XRE-family HTH domain